MSLARRAVPAILFGLALAALAACHHHTQPDTVGGAASPAPSATPVVLGCGLGPGGGTGEDCPMESPSFHDEVERAIDQAVAEHPEMVNTARARGCGNCWQVLDTHNFPEEVGRNLAKMGLCWTYDGEELAVKKVNDFNDQYDILLSEGYIRRDVLGSYRATCRPAWF